MKTVFAVLILFHLAWCLGCASVHGPAELKVFFPPDMDRQTPQLLVCRYEPGLLGCVPISIISKPEYVPQPMSYHPHGI